MKEFTLHTSTTTQLGIDHFDIIKENQTVFKHNRTGCEGVTLHDLWSFCRRKDTYQSQVVVYLHSKGSFHDSTGQKQLREYLTKGALSEECLTLPNQCNVCSTRISPLPHLHVPGIMWASRCDYVSRLVDPLAFEDAMTSYMGRAKTLDQKCKQGSPACVGRDRFSYEHWVLSHPRAHPCDLDSNDAYIWGAPWGSSGGKDIDKSMNAFAQGVKGAKELKSIPRFGFAMLPSNAGVILFTPLDNLKYTELLLLSYELFHD